MASQLLKRTEVEKRYCLSRSTIYRLMDEGLFPRPVRLGSRSVAWKESDLEQWLEERSRKTQGA
ncbi:helix-turn-helix transcriptional regulator [Marinobacterium aestuariivivens]|uniref:Helix-turn-helix transcriptional regulator n=1 Tax=Marinobacterium aestuariivivens TaxID=1698799 RepID=A0ABW2A4U8_9GAMM